jgi:hypothetical protein
MIGLFSFGRFLSSSSDAVHGRVKLDCKAIAVSFIFEGIVEVSFGFFWWRVLEAAHFSSLARSLSPSCV